jgi:hypothetical protein
MSYVGEYLRSTRPPFGSDGSELASSLVLFKALNMELLSITVEIKERNEKTHETEQIT